AFVLNQAANQVGEHRVTMLTGAAELGGSLEMSHNQRGDSNDRGIVSYRVRAVTSSLGASRRSGSKVMPRVKPSAASFSLISLSDFLPKLRYLSISCSLFIASWPTVVILALFKQLAARTLSSISLTLILRSFFSFMFSSLTPAGVSSNSITSSLKLTKTSR